MEKEARMKKLIKNLLSRSGYRIEKISPTVLNPKRTNKSMNNVLALLSKRHPINTIIDVGASNGSWSALAMKYYPLCNYLLVEAQPIHETALKQFISAHHNSQYALAAAGDREGQIYFDATDPLGGQASFTPYQVNNIVVPVTSIDNEIKNRNLPGPYLLKTDTHGFEVPILKGASHTLSETDAIIMECYNFKISPECLLFYEMCNYLDGLGFRCVNLVNPEWRPYDDALWQMDLIFIRKNMPEFSYLAYF